LNLVCLFSKARPPKTQHDYPKTFLYCTVPPDTTTFALVNSGLSLTFSSSPTHADKSLLVSTDGAANEDAKAFDFISKINNTQSGTVERHCSVH